MRGGSKDGASAVASGGTSAGQKTLESRRRAYLSRGRALILQRLRLLRWVGELRATRRADTSCLCTHRCYVLRVVCAWQSSRTLLPLILTGQDRSGENLLLESPGAVELLSTILQVLTTTLLPNRSPPRLTACPQAVSVLEARRGTAVAGS